MCYCVRFLQIQSQILKANHQYRQYNNNLHLLNDIYLLTWMYGQIYKHADTQVFQYIPIQGNHSCPLSGCGHMSGLPIHYYYCIIVALYLGG